MKKLLLTACWLAFSALGLQAQLFEDFEDGTKGAYAGASVTLSSGNWFLNDALLGTLAGDKKNSAQSVRIRNTGTVEMAFDKLNGAGKVTVYHARYGTDGASNWELQVSTNGGTTWDAWTSGTQTSTATLTARDFNVEVTGAVRIRIVKTSGGTNRLNFDDITITDFESSCTEPTGQAEIATGAFNEGDLTLDLTAGTGGTGRIVVARAFAPVTFIPTSGTSYAANSTYGAGTDLGGGQYVVYNGSGTSFVMSNTLLGQTTYFAIYEYANAADPCYLSPAHETSFEEASGRQTYAFQGFETASCTDNWGYTDVVNAGGSVPAGAVSVFPSSGARAYRFGGANTGSCSGGSNCIGAGNASGCSSPHGDEFVTEPLENLGALQGKLLSLAHRTHSSPCNGAGFDGGNEGVDFDIRVNGGAWTNIAQVRGSSDLLYDYNGNVLGGTITLATVTPATYSGIGTLTSVFPLTIALEDGVSSVQLRATIVYNNMRADEVLYIDDLSLSTTTDIEGLWSGLSSNDWTHCGNWGAFTQPTTATDVTIPAGAPNMPVVADADDAVCRDLTINTGATLNGTSNAIGDQDIINIYGENLIANGNIGNTGRSLGFQFRTDGSASITGTGATFNASRIRKNGNYVTNLNINRDIDLAYSTTAIYNNNNNANSTFNVTIPAGVTVSVAGDVCMDGVEGDAGNRGGSYTIAGTLDINGNAIMTTDNTAAHQNISWTVQDGGLLRCRNILANNVGGADGKHTLTLAAGSTVEITGTDGGFTGTGPFGNTYVYDIAPTSTVIYSATGNQPVAHFDYGHLIFEGSGTKDFPNTGPNNNIGIAGDWTIRADAAVGHSAGSRNLDIAGNLTLADNATFANSAHENLSIRTTGNAAQTFTAANTARPIRCYNLTSIKTAGSLTLAANTWTESYNNLRTEMSGTASFVDGGNTLTVGDDIRMTGAAARYNLTGTLRMTGISGLNDIRTEDDTTPEAELNNLTIVNSGASGVQIYPASGGGNLRIKGNLDIQNGNLLAQGNNILLGGNWTSYGADAAPAAFVPGTGRVTFDGSGLQEITIAQGADPLVQTSFHNVTFDNSANFTLEGIMGIANQLQLSNGVVTAANPTHGVLITNTALNAIVKGDGSIVDHTNGASYINGSLTRTTVLAGIYPYPVGSATNYRLLEYNQRTASTNPFTSINVRFNTTSPNAASLAALVNTGTGFEDNLASFEYVMPSSFWNIAPVSMLTAPSTINYDVEVYVSEAALPFCDGDDCIAYSLLKGNAGTWDNGESTAEFYGNIVAAKFSGLSANNSVRRNGYTSFSEIVVIGSPMLPLPVEQLNFNGEVAADGSALLRWKAGTEQDLMLYQLERSNDADSYETLAEVTPGQRGYQVPDHTFRSQAFYRLRMLDYDGSVSYSNVVHLSAQQAPRLALYPNPASDHIRLSCSGNCQDTRYAAQLVNNLGQVVWQAEGQLQEVSSTLNQQFTALANGVYNLNLSSTSQRQILRFVKE